MRTGFAILAHDRLDRAAALARHLAAHGAPVVVHVDQRVPVSGDFGNATVISTQKAEWGMMGLVDAALDAVAILLRDHPPTAHVMLASGSCLPVRPVAELDTFLEDRPGHDFIESVPVAEARWVQGGLSEERFTLRFPLAWKRHRRAFDALVTVQRGLGLRRRLPDGLVPHLGSQWWCLSARTLTALLADSRLPAWRAFFRRSWIPDESFFQSLVRIVGDPSRLVPQSLTLARFDPSGQPHVFHDDHGDWLAACEHFMARKADPDASALHARFLDAPREAMARPEFTGRLDDAPFAAAGAARLSEPAGLQTQSRYPSGSGPRLLASARSWGMIAGRDPALVAAALGLFPAAHGRLFAREGAAFAGNATHGPGNLPSDAVLRDYRPEQFLARLIFARREHLTLFGFVPGDTPRIGQMALRDANARVVLLEEGATLLPLLAEKKPAPVHASVTHLDAAALRAELGSEPGPATAALRAALADSGEDRA